MSDKQLLPCPFCGGELRKNIWGSLEDTNKDCILYGFEIHPKMIPLWNTRKPMDKIVERLKEVGKSEISFHGGRCNGKTLALGYVKGIENAIEIVKEGMNTNE